MGRTGKRDSGRLTPDEEQEMARLEARCRDLTDKKGITDTVHHSRLAELHQKAAGAPVTKEMTDDTTT